MSISEWRQRSATRDARPERAGARVLARGFTLIELLIVIAILGLSASLVGGIALERLEKARAQSEYQDLERLAQGLSFRAWANGRPVMLQGNGSELRWHSGTDPDRVRALKFWFVQPEQSIVIDAHGIAAPAFLAIADAHAVHAERRIALNAWLEHGR